MKTDTELLRDYAARRSEAAFGEIVRRYADFVYSAALRQVRSPEPARDVAQIVFADLARKARSLNANTLLIGWLCRAARLAAIEQLRRDRRRLQRERQAMEWNESSSEIPNNWGETCPILDEAIASLCDEDRNALLLRFFKNESLTSVGDRLGISEDAAQKRISRALGKLREFLAGHGISTTASALSVALVANAVQAAPSGLVGSLTTYALTGAAGSSTSSFLKLLTTTNMKTAVLVLALAGGIAALVPHQLRTQRLLRTAQSVAEQQTAEIQGLRGINEQLMGQTNELAGLREEAKDILRLRAEVARLRQEQAVLRKTAGDVQRAAVNAPTESNEPPVLITGKFISVPTGKLNDSGWAKIQPGRPELMADDQIGSILQALQKGGGMEILSSPRVQTANGVEARLSATQQVALGGTNADVGTTLTLNPHYSTNSPNISLDLAAELSQAIDTSPNQDESQRELRKITITNSVVVLDGQSILLREDFKEDGQIIGSTNVNAGPKSLLVLLTPCIVHEGGLMQRLRHIVKRADTNP